MKLNKLPRNFWKDPIHFVALGFGSGLSPIMPGTCGTIVAIPIFLILSHLPLAYYLAVLVIMTALGIWLCGRTARDLGETDPPSANLDEIVGYLTTMIAAPISWQAILIGFILFRIFDIWKPWPISWLDDHIHGGFGIVADDILAGLYALILLQFILWSCS